MTLMQIAWVDCSYYPQWAYQSLRFVATAVTHAFKAGKEPRTMTKSNNENLTRKLDHILSLIDICCEQFRHITCSERAAMLLTLRMASAQVAKNVSIVRNLLFERIVDEFGVNYAEYARKFETARKKFEEMLAGAPMIDCIDTTGRPITGTSNIMRHENTIYNIEEKDASTPDGRINTARYLLVDNATEMYDEIMNELLYIAKDLRGIQEDYYQLLDHPEFLEEKLDNLRNAYIQNYWEEDKSAFMQDVRDHVADHGNKKENYERYQRQMDKELDDLTELSMNHSSVAVEILRNRDRITLEDILLHFSNKMCMDLLMLRIQAFDMLEPCTLYKDLFVNRAVCSFVMNLQKMIALYGGIVKNYQFAALKMALDDLGLTYKSDEKRNGTEFMKFINDTYLKNGDKIQEATSITKKTGLLLGRSFGKLDTDFKGTNLTEADYNKLVVPYHRCLWIIGKALDVDYKNAGFAERFYEEPIKLPAVEDYTDTNDNPIIYELQQLKSVLRGDLMRM